MWFAVRRETLEKIMEDKEWRERFENTKTIAEAKQVMEQFCKKEGFESKRINPHPQFSAVKAI